MVYGIAKCVQRYFWYLTVTFVFHLLWISKLLSTSTACDASVQQGLRGAAFMPAVLCGLADGLVLFGNVVGIAMGGYAVYVVWCAKQAVQKMDILPGVLRYREPWQRAAESSALRTVPPMPTASVPSYGAQVPSIPNASVPSYGVTEKWQLGTVPNYTVPLPSTLPWWNSPSVQTQFLSTPMVTLPTSTSMVRPSMQAPVPLNPMMPRPTPPTSASLVRSSVQVPLPTSTSTVRPPTHAQLPPTPQGFKESIRPASSALRTEPRAHSVPPERGGQDTSVPTSGDVRARSVSPVRTAEDSPFPMNVGSLLDD